MKKVQKWESSLPIWKTRWSGLQEETMIDAAQTIGRDPSEMLETVRGGVPRLYFEAVERHLSF